MLDRLVRRTVLANAERVVRPDIDHMQAHQRRETHCRFHVVREDEERAAGRNHAAVQRHAVGHAGHRQLRNARLEEFTAEVALRKGFGLLEEAVGLVRIRKVGRGHDHVLDFLGEHAQHRGRCGARGHVGFHLDSLVVDFGKLAREEHVELVRQLLVLRTPRLLDLRLTRGPVAQLCAALGKRLAALFEHRERICSVAPEVFDRGGEVGAGSRERLSVGRNLVLEALAGGAFGTLAHDGAADDERRALRFGVGRHERLADFIDVLAVDRKHVPAPRLVFHRHVLGHHLVDLG